MTVLITDIAEFIKQGVDDQTLNDLINKHLQFLVNRGHKSTTIDKWKKDNYAKLRQWTYPPIEEYIDSHVKINSGNKSLEKEGQKQLSDYYKKCLDVKSRFSKKFDGD